MLLHRIVISCILLLLVAGCAINGSGSPHVQLDGTADDVAAAKLAEFLAQNGLPAEVSPGGDSLFAYRNAQATLLSPVVDADGLDRLIASRNYAPAPGKDVEDLQALVTRLNNQLNVGAFAVDEGTLLLQANLTFIDRLALDELIAFLDWLDDVEDAIRIVDGDQGALHISRP